MDREELLEFISEIISCGNKECINLSLVELRNIMVREEVSEELIRLVTDLYPADVELADLGKAKQGGPVTMEELGKAMREGVERIRKASRC